MPLYLITWYHKLQIKYNGIFVLQSKTRSLHTSDFITIDFCKLKKRKIKDRWYLLVGVKLILFYHSSKHPLKPKNRRLKDRLSSSYYNTMEYLPWCNHLLFFLNIWSTNSCGKLPCDWTSRRRKQKLIFVSIDLSKDKTKVVVLNGVIYYHCFTK